MAQRNPCNQTWTGPYPLTPAAQYMNRLQGCPSDKYNQLEEDGPHPVPLMESARAARKNQPMATGLLDYFPDALAAVARLSKRGNDKHNPGEPLHWAREKSNDHADCIMRHLKDRGTWDVDNDCIHEVAVAWRALALAQVALEQTGTKA